MRLEMALKLHQNIRVKNELVHTKFLDQCQRSLSLNKSIKNASIRCHPIEEVVGPCSVGRAVGLKLKGAQPFQEPGVCSLLRKSHDSRVETTR